MKAALHHAGAACLRHPVFLSVLLLALVQLHEDAALFPGWIGWSDQDYYLRAAVAWAHGNLDPSQHHYPPGYALLAVPFVYLTPTQPFLLPNLFCSAASLILFTRIARRLAPQLRHADAVAAACFLACSAIGEVAVRNWVVPWSTTAAAPLLLTCLLMALRYRQTGWGWNLAAMGFAAGLCAAVRPTDAAVVFAACAGFCLLCLLPSANRKSMPGAAALTAAGLCAGLLPGLAAQLAAHGLSPGEYIGGSAAMGFEWRLIPQRWVTIAVSPRPLFPEGTGMQAVFPWLLPGIAGMALAALPGRAAAPANRFVAVTILLYWLLYLSYRDLHPYSLWRYNNVHYFLWTLPFLAFWAIGAVLALAARRTALHAIAALAAASLLFCWRPVFVPEAAGTEATQNGRAGVPHGLSPIDRAVLLSATGAWRQIYFSHGTVTIGGQPFSGMGYFHLFPVPGGFMLLPLRPLPEGAATLSVPDSVHVPPQAPWIAGTVHLMPGIPCLLTPRSGDCTPGRAILPPDRGAGP